MMERDAENLDQQIEESMQQEEESRRVFEHAEKGGLPDGMGNTSERLENDSPELHEARQDFNEQQERVIEIRSDVDKRQFEIEQRTNQGPQENIGDVSQEWLRRRYGEDPELTAMQAEQAEQVDHLRGESEKLDEMRDQVKQEQSDYYRERLDRRDQ